MKADVFAPSKNCQLCVSGTLPIGERVLPRASAGKTVTEIRLRRGPVISATPEHSLWPHFSDIWYHQSYTKHFSIPSDSVVVDVGANVGVFSLVRGTKGPNRLRAGTLVVEFFTASVPTQRQRKTSCRSISRALARMAKLRWSGRQRSGLVFTHKQR
jgi:hypothetical protein